MAKKKDIIDKKTNAIPSALPGIAEGIRKCAEIVGSTMGSRGMNVILEDEEYPFHRITNDGATIISRIIPEDPLEKIGADFLKEAIDRSNRNAGDGSSTTVILTDAFINHCVTLGYKGMLLKREMDSMLPEIEEEIRKQTKEITIDDVHQVASIAGESDDLGLIIRDIYRQIGTDGIITIESSGTDRTSFTITDGIRFSGAGMLSAAMVRDEAAVKEGRPQTKAVYENPPILVTKRKFTSFNEFNPLMEAIEKSGRRELVIFCNDFDSKMASALVMAHKSSSFSILIICAPTLWGPYAFEDFAKATGATIVEDATGVTFKNLGLHHLGSCGKLVTDREDTVITGFQDISGHIKALQDHADQTASTDSLLRISYLCGKTATLRLGSKSETELSYLHLKAEDAVRAAQSALKEGIVTGGGVCLANIGMKLRSRHRMAALLTAPYWQILDNAGISVEPIRARYKIPEFDVRTCKETDLMAAGIVDSAAVVRNAVRNAIGIASTVLTSSSAVLLPRKTPEQIAAEAMKKQGIRPM